MEQPLSQAAPARLRGRRHRKGYRSLCYCVRARAGEQGSAMLSGAEVRYTGLADAPKAATGGETEGPGENPARHRSSAGEHPRVQRFYQLEVKVLCETNPSNAN